MSASNLINLTALIDDVKCFELIRQHRWPESITCPSCRLNLSNLQIAKDLELHASDVQAMTSQLRDGLTARIPPPELSGTIEADEVYVVAGHKGHPDAVQKS